VEGSLSLETPMLFAIGFLSSSRWAASPGLVLSLVPIDTSCRTLLRVAHFH